MITFTERELHIYNLLLRDKLADNEYRANHIMRGLKLSELKSDDEILARARLYRDWRNSQIFGKNTASCYEKAIKGEPVLPKDAEPMFDGASLSEANNG